jgi:hypothetical protein
MDEYTLERFRGYKMKDEAVTHHVFSPVAVSYICAVSGPPVAR